MADDEVDVGEQMSDSLVIEKAKNWQMFLTILQNIQFLQDEVFHSVEMRIKGILISWWNLAQKLILESPAELKKKTQQVYT